MFQQNNNYQTGINGEELASKHLVAQGYQIIATRYLTKLGEIDLIAAKQDLLAIIEVKTRTTIEQCLHAISRRQQRRVYQAAEFFIMQHPKYARHNISLDLIAVNHNGQVVHYPNAWC